jgi:hypothetical protein
MILYKNRQFDLTFLCLSENLCVPLRLIFYHKDHEVQHKVAQSNKIVFGYENRSSL